VTYRSIAHRRILANGFEETRSEAEGPRLEIRRVYGGLARTTEVLGDGYSKSLLTS